MNGIRSEAFSWAIGLPVLAVCKRSLSRAGHFLFAAAVLSVLTLGVSPRTGAAQPVIDVDPASLAASQGPDVQSTLQMTITNNGDATLTWFVVEDDGPCDSPDDIPWLSVAPDAGSTPVMQSTVVGVTVDSTGLLPSAYAANLCVHSTDPSGPLVQVPVTLTIRLSAAVDVKPQSCPNPINVDSRGVVPVAILGTADLDVTTIDPVTVQLGGVSPLRWAREDVATPFNGDFRIDAFDCTTLGPDGFDDLTLKFKAEEIVAALGEVQDGQVLLLELTGSLRAEYGGGTIRGEDVIVVLEGK